MLRGPFIALILCAGACSPLDDTIINEPGGLLPEFIEVEFNSASAEPQTKSIQIQHTGDGDTRIMSVTVEAGAEFELLKDGERLGLDKCAATQKSEEACLVLKRGGVLDLEVKFTPRVPGTVSGDFIFDTSVGFGTVVSVTGNTENPKLSISGGSASSWKKSGDGFESKLTFFNAAEVDLEIKALAFSSSSDAGFAVKTAAPFTVGAGKTKNIDVTYSGTAAEADGKLVITTNQLDPKVERTIEFKTP